MCTRYFLSHGSQETLRVEESGHPENFWTSVENPVMELLVAFDQFGEPEPNSGRLPRNLMEKNAVKPIQYDVAIMNWDDIEMHFLT